MLSTRFKCQFSIFNICATHSYNSFIATMGVFVNDNFEKKLFSLSLHYNQNIRILQLNMEGHIDLYTFG